VLSVRSATASTVEPLLVVSIESLLESKQTFRLPACEDGGT
jgi:hypothetical protein